ncbi:hypothetical protein P9112_011386 [Eukaryota sp. TZLM1-RC]
MFVIHLPNPFILDVLFHTTIRFRTKSQLVSHRFSSLCKHSLGHISSLSLDSEFLNILELQALTFHTGCHLVDLHLPANPTIFERHVSSFAYLIKGLPCRTRVHVPLSVEHLSLRLGSADRLTTLYGSPTSIIDELQRSNGPINCNRMVLVGEIDLSLLNFLFESCVLLNKIKLVLADEYPNVLLTDSLWISLSRISRQIVEFEIVAPSLEVAVTRASSFITSCSSLRKLSLCVKNEELVWEQLYRTLLPYSLTDVILHSPLISQVLLNKLSHLRALTLPYKIVSKTFQLPTTLRSIKVLGLPSDCQLSLAVSNPNIEKFSFTGSTSWSSLSCFLIPMEISKLEILNTVLPEKQLSSLSVCFPYLEELSITNHSKSFYSSHPSTGTALVDLLGELRHLRALKLAGCDLNTETFHSENIQFKLHYLHIEDCLGWSCFLYAILPCCKNLYRLAVIRPVSPREYCSESLVSLIGSCNCRTVELDVVPEPEFSLREALSEIEDQSLTLTTYLH